MNIYDLSGAEFLKLFLGAQALSLTAAVLTRKLLLFAPEAKDLRVEKLDSYDAAYLNGGCKHMFLTIMAALDHQGLLSLNLSAKKAALKEKLPKGAHPLEHTVANAMSSSETSIRQLYEQVEKGLDRHQQKLVREGLVPTEARKALATLLPAILTILPALLIGIPKVFVGLHRHRPVDFLIMLLVVSLIAAIGFAMKSPFRTKLGEKKLKDWRLQNRALESSYKSLPEQLQTSELALGYALFAAGSYSLLSPQAEAMAATSGSNIWSYRSASSSGFSSSSGCGSSCGGGCGGGCGGCGG